MMSSSDSWSLCDFTIQNGYTGLMRASGGGSVDIVRVLLEAKADPNIITQVTLHCITATLPIRSIE